MVCENIFTTSKSHYWFKSYGNFAGKKIIFFPIGQSGEASRWSVCYQGGLPRLVWFKV